MTETDETEPSIADQIAAIRAEQEAADLAKAAAAQQEAEAIAKLNAVKKRCDEACSEVQAALAEATDPYEREALARLEAETHAPHAAELEAAYLEFSGQRVGDSNPAAPGDAVQLESHVAVASEAGA